MQASKNKEKQNTSADNVRSAVEIGVEADVAKVAAPRNIQSVERALSMLELLASSSGKLRLNDISKTLGLNVSTCHHLLGTLVDHGYVGRSPSDRTYFLGNKILELSGSHLRQFSLADVVLNDLKRFNQVTGETVHLAALQGDELVTLVVLDSPHAVRVAPGAASKSQALHATATGKAILAWLPETEINRILKRTGLRSITDQTITDKEILLEELGLVRRRGFSIDLEEFQPGVICVGAAIRDHAGAVIGSFSCSTPTMRANKAHMKMIKETIKDVTLSISKALGASGDVL